MDTTLWKRMDRNFWNEVILFKDPDPKGCMNKTTTHGYSSQYSCKGVSSKSKWYW